MTATPAEDRVYRLLVCDDSIIERQGFAHIFRNEGFEVFEAAEGSAAIAVLKQEPIDLVLLDLNMPQVDGFGVLQYLQEQRPNLPVIVLSGMEPDNIQHGMHKLSKHELPTLLMKPVTPEQLLTVVELGLSGQLNRAAGGLQAEV